MAIHKYASGLPFYRQQGLQGMLGLGISASTIFDQCEYLANAAKPIANRLAELAADASYFNIDDTTNRILDAKPLKKRRRGSSGEVTRTGVYSSCLLAKIASGTIVLFKTNIGHAGEFIDEILCRRDLSFHHPSS